MGLKKKIIDETSSAYSIDDELLMTSVAFTPRDGELEINDDFIILDDENGRYGGDGTYMDVNHTLSNKNTYNITRDLFSRCLALIYFLSFLVDFNQIVGMVGSNGVWPAIGHTGDINVINDNNIWDSVKKFPSVFMLLNISDFTLNFVAFLGVLISLLVLLTGFCGCYTFCILWILKLSLHTIMTTLPDNACDLILLECGFLSIFIYSPFKMFDLHTDKWTVPLICRWCFRWLAYRIVFSSGISKLNSFNGWLDLNAFKFLLKSIALPTPFTYYFYKLSNFHPIINGLMTGLLLFYECVLSIFIIIPIRRCRIIGGILTIIYSIFFTIIGNFGTFYLTLAVVSLFCFDDAILEQVINNKYNIFTKASKLARRVSIDVIEDLLDDEVPTSNLNDPHEQLKDGSDNYSNGVSPDVTSVPLGVESSSNLLSQKGGATPGDRGDMGVYGDKKHNNDNLPHNAYDNPNSPGNNLWEFTGEVNKEGVTPTGKSYRGHHAQYNPGMAVDEDENEFTNNLLKKITYKGHKEYIKKLVFPEDRLSSIPTVYHNPINYGVQLFFLVMIILLSYSCMNSDYNRNLKAIGIFIFCLLLQAHCEATLVCLLMGQYTFFTLQGWLIMEMLINGPKPWSFLLWIGIFELQLGLAITMNNLQLIFRTLIQLFVIQYVIFYSTPLVLKSLIHNYNINNAPFDIINYYGGVTKVAPFRYEIVVQGTMDSIVTNNTKWEEYKFKCKPSDVDMRPCFLTFYNYELDYILNHVSQLNLYKNSDKIPIYLVEFIKKLLLNSNDTINLLQYNPFKDRKPKFIRILNYQYTYGKGNSWYDRKFKNVIVPPLYIPHVTSSVPENYHRNPQGKLNKKASTASGNEIHPTTSLSTRRGGSSNYLSLKGGATPGDRGEGEVVEGRGVGSSRSTRGMPLEMADEFNHVIPNVDGLIITRS